MVNLIQNLIFLYHTMVATERLLIMAVEQASGELKDYFRAHLEEERGHEVWLREDLQSVGVDVRRTILPREALEMVGSVYYLIFHVDAAALLGYMQVMEQPTSLEKLERLEQEYPVSLLRTLRYHAVHDPNHYADLQAIIQTLSPERRLLVEQTRQQSYVYCVRALSLRNDHEHVPRSDAADVGALQGAVPRSDGREYG